MHTLLAAAPAAAPMFVDGNRPDGAFDGEWVGHLGAAGTAFALTFILFIGTRKNADHQIKPIVALFLGFLTSNSLAAAGGAWALPSDLIHQGLAAAGLGSGLGPFGDVGMGSLAIVCIATAWFTRLSSRAAAWLGLVAGVIFVAAGGIWGSVAYVGAQLIGTIG
ncbi:hypothetical protein GCM10027160_23700 [Streptomyces calidiresistens]|uniref:Uncharacterized protein n=1 Tax=Streptomyces calidiresistens TaxID=1485586 RepID=A0A7W3XYS8_9ACTN|nr:hypothetical protein [Streptomyces calidiresistens]MBB0232460.1 hypothetical protein [Streptomyces calidiresistens]